MGKTSRVFMFFSFALIDFLFFPGIGMKALGGVFLILGITTLIKKPNNTNAQ